MKWSVKKRADKKALFTTEAVSSHLLSCIELLTNYAIWLLTYMYILTYGMCFGVCVEGWREGVCISDIVQWTIYVVVHTYDFLRL